VSAIENVLARLESHKLKKAGQGKWVACCPAHEDRTPSLSIAEGQDGRVLLHCFGGCGVDAVVGALGLGIEDLFPEDGQHTRSARTTTYRQALEVIKVEVALVALAARNLAGGHELHHADLERLRVAERRITGAMQACGL
jgi:hypothetical protein